MIKWVYELSVQAVDWSGHATVRGATPSATSDAIFFQLHREH
jgi:hypothetical protein